LQLYGVERQREAVGATECGWGGWDGRHGCCRVGWSARGSSGRGGGGG
jgi:hypothetical protein